MNVSSVKSLIENYSIARMQAAEEALMNDMPLPFDVEGKDEGEQLTHLLAAIYCKQEMEQSGITVNEALRLYGRRVRNSIN